MLGQVAFDFDALLEDLPYDALRSETSTRCVTASMEMATINRRVAHQSGTDRRVASEEPSTKFCALRRQVGRKSRSMNLRTLDDVGEGAHRGRNEGAHSRDILLATLAGNIGMRKGIDTPRPHGRDRLRHIVGREPSGEDHRHPRT